MFAGVSSPLGDGLYWLGLILAHHSLHISLTGNEVGRNILKEQLTKILNHVITF
jgi:hypothetical protein